tara:strand:+ start:2924 stop:3589 length:666 start_codon:yes stop_codon:yes gene_type:complete
MPNNGYYKSKRTFEPGKTLPDVSNDLDSVRAYQFEITFKDLQVGNNVGKESLTLAAKRVSGLATRNEFITVDRVNDKLYYPGKVTNEDLQIEFDNLYIKDTAGDLYKYFKTIYDPITGEMTKNARPGGAGQGSFKTAMIQIVELNNTMTPHATTNVFGAFPISWAASEFNYATNDFHTLTLTMKYDFLDRPEAYFRTGNRAAVSVVNSLFGTGIDTNLGVN